MAAKLCLKTFHKEEQTPKSLKFDILRQFWRTTLHIFVVRITQRCILVILSFHRCRVIDASPLLFSLS